MADDDFRGKMGGLTAEEMDEFLAGRALARLATLTPDGGPYVVPVWYQWDGSALWFVGRERSVWCTHIERDGRVAVVIDSEHGDPDEPDRKIPKVIMEGTAEVVERPNVGGRWVDVAEEMSYRYLGPDGPTYLTSTLQQPRWLVKMTPSTIKTWKGVGWARRYWVSTSGGPSYEEAHGD